MPCYVAPQRVGTPDGCPALMEAASSGDHGFKVQRTQHNERAPFRPSIIELPGSVTQRCPYGQAVTVRVSTRGASPRVEDQECFGRGFQNGRLWYNLSNPLTNTFSALWVATVDSATVRFVDPAFGTQTTWRGASRTPYMLGTLQPSEGAHLGTKAEPLYTWHPEVVTHPTERFFLRLLTDRCY